jgi:hypothetical protein
VISYYITANNPKVSPDFARRCFYVEFETPDTNVEWEISLHQFIVENSAKVVADILWILRRPRPEFDSKRLIKNEGFGFWCRDVLARVLGFPPVAEVVGNATAEEVVIVNQERRESADQDLEDALNFGQGVLERVCQWKGFYNDGLSFMVPKEPVFVPTIPPPEKEYFSDEDRKRFKAQQRNNMAQYYREIMQRDDVSAKWLKPWIENHIYAGRIPWMTWRRTATERGFWIQPQAIKDFLENRKNAEKASQASDASSDKPEEMTQ